MAAPDGHIRVFWTKREILSPDEEAEAENSPSGVVGAGDLQKAVERGTDSGLGSKKDEEDEEDKHIRQIYTSEFDGTRWSPQEQLTRGEYNGFPSAAYDSTGILHLVWYGFDGQFYQIVYGKLQNGRWSDPALVSLGYPDSLNPVIAIDSKNDLHAAWYKYAPATKSYQIYYRSFSGAENRWTEQLQLSTGLRSASNVSLAIGADDTVYAAYEGEPASGGSDVYIRMLRNGAWGLQNRVAALETTASMPSVAVDSGGRAFVFFQSEADGQVHLATSNDWTRSTAVITSGKNMYPNAADSIKGRGIALDRIELVWTQVDADPTNPLGANLIRYGYIRSDTGR